MNRNTISLLNSPWLITDAGATALVPSLLSMVRGIAIPEAKPDAFGVFAYWDDEDEEFDQVDEAPDTKHIAVISIKNAIFKYDQSCGPRGTKSMMKLMKAWEGDDSVMGVVLDIDSGGGQAAGTGEFAKFIAGYSKPVVAYTDGMICSAAYWLASACKGGIIANPNADFIGSIGTMISYVNLKGILTKEGAVIEDIYASLSTRKNEEVRAKEGEDSNELIITNILDPYNTRFHEAVAINRPGIPAEAYTGAISLPAEALSLHLVDSLGTINDAFDKVISLSKNSKSNTTMSKQRANVQAVLGLSEPLATTDNGSYLNETQLDSIENSLTTAVATEARLTSELGTATTAQTKAEGDLTAAQKAHQDATDASVASVDAMLTGAGLTASGTLSEKLTALDSHLKVVNKLDGAKPTNVHTDGKKPTATAGYVDANASHNQIANELFN